MMSRKEEPEVYLNVKEGELEVEYFDIFPTRNELAYHKYLMYGPIPSIFLRNPIITEGCPLNLKYHATLRHIHIKKVYIDLNSPLNIMTRMLNNWIMRRKLNPREDINRGLNNFTGRIKGMYVFVGNFTYVIDFMIVEDISSIIDLRLSQVVLGKPFVKTSNMNPPERVVSIKVNGVTDDAILVYIFPHSLTHHATAWFDHFLRNSINTFEQMVKMFLGKYFPPSMVTELKNEITNFRQRPDESLFEAWERYKLSIDRCPNHNMLPVTQIDTFYKGLTSRHRDTINAAAGRTFMKRRPEECYDLIKNMTAHHNDWDTSAQRSESLIRSFCNI
uniref:Reverse transcriptase domain-containing protein n=1 Tax=Tanacetum cinerariifolium TaxID=118510 RepID=A0A6L2NV73_TANCI|nr:reverse transcriptase domain-containing protein [Tanacetum cinerariifolium]